MLLGFAFAESMGFPLAKVLGRTGEVSFILPQLTSAPSKEFAGVQIPPAGGMDTLNRRDINTPAPSCVGNSQFG